jgi:hypothetical protein
MLISSAVWILITSPIVGTLNILILYAPAIIFLAAAGVLALLEREQEDQTL